MRTTWSVCCWRYKKRNGPQRPARGRFPNSRRSETTRRQLTRVFEIDCGKVAVTRQQQPYFCVEKPGAFRQCPLYHAEYRSYGGFKMKDHEGIKLDARELLGLSQVAKISGDTVGAKSLGRVLSKIGDEGTPPPPTTPRLAKIG